MTADLDDIIHFLKEDQLLDSNHPVRVSPLQGGVSSDIHLIENGPNKYVLKEALERLKVSDVWEADVSRNFAEQAFIEYVSTFRPDAVPKIIYRDQVQPYFMMEYLGPPFVNWKAKLLAGSFELLDASRIVDLLVDIHNHSHADKRIPGVFDYSDNFYSLRIEPYLITTGDRHPDLKNFFHKEAERLRTCHVTLVHGDFSPKNLLVSEDRVVLLDHEVANYGDPAFDLAFLLNHIILKRIHLKDKIIDQSDLAIPIWENYFDGIALDNIPDLMSRTSRLILMLLLARVDGKSPVEYLKSEDQQRIRDFTYRVLPGPESNNFKSYYQQILQW